MSRFADRGDSLDWARRIMRRFHAGEYVSIIAIEMACDVLHINQPQKRSSSGRGSARRNGAA